MRDEVYKMEDKGVLTIASSGILYGLVTVGGSLLSKRGFSVLDISFFFVFFSILVLAPFSVKKDRKVFSMMKSNWKFFLSYALVNLFILLSQFGSLALGLNPPVVALLLYTQPIWTIIFGRFAFKQTITSIKLGIIVMALIGVFLLSSADFSFDLIYLVLFAVFAGAIPDYLFYRGVDKVPATQAGVILLLEPVSASILSVILRISVLSWLQLVGGAIILLSNYLVMLERKKVQSQSENKGYQVVMLNCDESFWPAISIPWPEE